MDCFQLFSENLVDQSTLTPSSENAQFPVENIQDYRRSKVFRSTSNADSIVLDFGETSDVEAFFVLADKRAGFGISTITLEFNGTNTWGAPAATETITFSTAHGVGFKEFASVHSYRYCRIVMTSTLGYCELANIFLGKKQELVRDINFNWTFQDDEVSIKKVNRYGQQFTDVINRMKNIRGNFALLDKDQVEEMHVALDNVGESKPVYIKLGDSSMSVDYRRYSGMFYIQTIPTMNNPKFNKFAFSIQLREAT